MNLIADPDNLRLAFWNAGKGKRTTPALLRYQRQLDTHLAELRQQLLAGKVPLGPYRQFYIYEPKKRLICAAAFSERVMHHAVMKVCHPFFEKSQICHSYASRPGKGVHAAVKLATQQAARFPWFLKLDVRKFFESIHHPSLKHQLSRLFKDPLLLTLLYRIIDSYSASPNRGLPIGNLTSQYFANHFLTGLDHFIIEKLKPGAYIRYMDDLVIWHSDKEVLKRINSQIKNYLALELKAELKPSQINHSSRGLPFLGYQAFPGRLKLAQRSKQRFIKKIRRNEENYHSGQMSEAAYSRKTLPLLAFVQFADTGAFRKKLFENERVSL